MTKLGAIARYELLMAWRRRSLPLLWVVLFVGVLGFGLLIESVKQQTPAMDQAVTQSAVDSASWAQGLDLTVAQNTLAVINMLVAALIVYAISVTLMLGETIPLDRQFRMRELLDATPVSKAAYFAGKLIGVWVGLIVGAVIVGIVCALALRLIFGVYDLRVFAALWTLMVLPLPLTAAALSILLCAPFASRRTAVLIGLLLVPVVLILSVPSILAFTLVAALIEPIYALGILVTPGALSNAEIVSGIVTMLLKLAGVVVAVWAFTWGWARTREGR